MTARARIPWWFRFVLCVAITISFQTFAIATLGAWPYIAAAYTVPLPATLGAILAEHLRDRSSNRTPA